MDPVDFNRDERLHPRYEHEWWYYVADLVDGAGRHVHYTTALMRRDLIWVSYFRWWREGETPLIQRAVHRVAPPSPGDPDLSIAPRDGWLVTIARGRSSHWLRGLGDIHFEDSEHGPALFTTQSEGGIATYGPGLEMAWYGWPRFRVRAFRPEAPLAERELSGVGWMEHQWGNTDFRRLRWRYTPVLLSDSAHRVMAYRFEHEAHPDAAQLRVGFLENGALQPLTGTLRPTGPRGGLDTQIDLGSRGALEVRSRTGGTIDWRVPGVPDFYEGPSLVTGSLDGMSVEGVAMTELHPLVGAP